MSEMLSDRLRDEIERLRAENEALRTENKALRTNIGTVTEALLDQFRIDDERRIDAERLRNLIPGCYCSDPSQCWEQCGTLGLDEKYAALSGRNDG